MVDSWKSDVVSYYYFAKAKNTVAASRSEKISDRFSDVLLYTLQQVLGQGFSKNHEAFTEGQELNSFARHLTF